MLVRQIVITASPEQLWDALTEPDALSAWFGSRVEWDLRPGGRAQFVEEDGTRRGGVVDEVQPGRRLRFRWWPEQQGQADDQGASQVSYDLEPDDEGTRLTVTERPVPAQPDTAAATSACSAHAAPVGGRLAGCERWTDWDDRLFGCWALTLTPVRAGLR
jgi:uncharacterized protein YndB with AHSA1/START domain